MDDQIVEDHKKLVCMEDHVYTVNVSIQRVEDMLRRVQLDVREYQRMGDINRGIRVSREQKADGSMSICPSCKLRRWSEELGFADLLDLAFDIGVPQRVSNWAQ